MNEITKVYQATEISTGNKIYLSVDNYSGGYPWWASSPIGNTWPISDKTTYEISTHFRNKSGEFYKNNVDPESLQVCSIGFVDFEPIKINQKTRFEEMKEKYNSMSENDVKFIKENM